MTLAPGVPRVRVVHRGFAPPNVVAHGDDIVCWVGRANKIAKGIVFVMQVMLLMVDGLNQLTLAVFDLGQPLIEGIGDDRDEALVPG